MWQFKCLPNLNYTYAHSLFSPHLEETESCSALRSTEWEQLNTYASIIKTDRRPAGRLTHSTRLLNKLDFCSKHRRAEISAITQINTVNDLGRKLRNGLQIPKSQVEPGFVNSLYVSSDKISSAAMFKAVKSYSTCHLLQCRLAHSPKRWFSLIINLTWE